jgi:AbrB family transcriptional regulator, stage V sporulation protein T
MTYHAKVIAGGKVVIPADIRRELGIKDGDSLVIDRDAKGAVVLRTREQIVDDVRQSFRSMLEDRAMEARREAGETGA